MSEKSGGGGGVGFVGLLTIAFIVLKLCGVIDWAWVWVLSPVWLVALFVAVCVVVAAVIVTWARVTGKANR